MPFYFQLLKNPKESGWKTLISRHSADECPPDHNAFLIQEIPASQALTRILERIQADSCKSNGEYALISTIRVIRLMRESYENGRRAALRQRWIECLTNAFGLPHNQEINLLFINFTRRSIPKDDSKKKVSLNWVAEVTARCFNCGMQDAELGPKR